MFYTQGIPPISRRIAGGLYHYPPYDTSSFDNTDVGSYNIPRGYQVAGSRFVFCRKFKPITSSTWFYFLEIWTSNGVNSLGTPFPSWSGYFYDVAEFGGSRTSAQCFVDGDPAKGVLAYQKNYSSANTNWPMNWSGSKAWFPQLCSHQIIMYLEINDEGSGYDNGNYQNLSTTTGTGSGSGLKVNVKVAGGKVTEICPNVYDVGTLYSSSYGSGDSTSSYGGGGYNIGDTGTIDGIPNGSGAEYKIGTSSADSTLFGGGEAKTVEICTFKPYFEPAQKRSTETLADYGVNLPGFWA